MYTDDPQYTSYWCEGSQWSCPLYFTGGGAGAPGVVVGIKYGGCSGTDITNNSSNPQPVVVGQQIMLCGSFTLPSGVTANYYSWSIPGDTTNPPTAVGNYIANTSGGSVTPTTVTEQTTTFYFVAPGNSLKVSFTLGYGNALAATATTSLNVSGPTAANIMTSHVGKVAITTVAGQPALQFGTLSASNAGILFTPSATPPTGSSNNFVWALLSKLAENTGR